TRSSTVRPLGYAGTLRHACSTAASGAATGRALEARSVADHGEVAAFRTGIALEAFQLRGVCRSSRDADDGRSGDRRRRDGWAVRQSVGRTGGERFFSVRDTAGPAIQYVKVAARVADAGDAAHRIGRRLGGVAAGRRQAVGDHAAADAVGVQVGLLDMREIAAAEIGDRQLAEHVVEDRRGHLDRVVALDHARRLEAGEGEGLDELLERHAVLQADRYRDGEVVHDAAEGCPFLVHVEEYLADPTVLVFAGAEIDLVPADDGLLRVALAPLGQPLAAARHFPLDDAFHDPLGDDRRPGGGRHVHEVIVRGDVVAESHRRERLRKLGAVAIEGVGLEAKLPGQFVSLPAVVYRCSIRHVDRFRDRA